MPSFRRRLTFANVVSVIALFVALGGSSYAALKLSKNSVKSSHIKNGQVKTVDLAKNAVRSNRVADRSLLAQDFAPGQLPAGAPGAAGTQGPKGDKGDPGAPGQFQETLASGTTLRGFWGHSWSAPAAMKFDNLFYSYGGYQLSAAPTPHLVPVGGPAPAGCAGGTFANPDADPGHLCVYEFSRNNSTAPEVCSISDCPGSDDNGFQVASESSGMATVTNRGSWAVTAP